MKQDMLVRTLNSQKVGETPLIVQAKTYQCISWQAGWLGEQCGLSGMCLMTETTELDAARRVVTIARVYRDWMFGGAITPQDKKELIEAVDAYDEVVSYE